MLIVKLHKYKSFLYSYYLGRGIRITAGVVLPALILSYFNLLPEGVAVSLGAMCVSITDNPGPIHHRRNGMLVCLLCLFIAALMTGLVTPFPVLTGILIFTLSFVFSIIGVYGARANSIGVAALLVMVLQTAHPGKGAEVFVQAGLIVAGGVWYIALSLLLYTFRPYLLAQQALGECMEVTAGYLRLRAAFYEAGTEYDNLYRQLAEKQAAVHLQQELVRELLFKSRAIVKESTPAAQTLLVLFTNSVDLFEKIMISYQDYASLHKTFRKNNLLEEYRQFILLLAQDLEDISIAVKSGKPLLDTGILENALQELQQSYETFRNEHRKPGNIEQFITLRQIKDNLEDIAGRLHTLHYYTGNGQPFTDQPETEQHYEKFISHQEVRPGLVIENLNGQSNYFRHALRVSIAALAGYCVAGLLNLGHGYWIMLTIIVILKPAYSLTKKRNYERLLGTIAGALAGMLILYFIHSKTALFVLMLLFMAGTFSLLQLNYMLSVIFMTPYVLLLFNLLYNGPVENIIRDRLLDTAIGSAIAWLVNLVLLPVWEKDAIGAYMVAAVEKNRQYLYEVAGLFTGQQDAAVHYKVSRKNAYVALANLADAFTRMLAEPGSKRVQGPQLHRFVVIMHQMTAHIAALAGYALQKNKSYTSHQWNPVIKSILSELEAAEALLNRSATPQKTLPPPDWNALQEPANYLLQKRREELQQQQINTTTRSELFALKPLTDRLHVLYSLAADCRKISAELSVNFPKI